MNYKKLLPLLVSFAIISACANDDTSSGASDNTKETADTYTPDTHNPSTAGHATEVPEGKILFEQKCTVCHGSDGTAGIGNAANLQISKADSTLSAQVIAEGKGSMPSFKSQLSTQQIRQLVGYVFSLRK
jgi:mono/diheme cytochrome c family protein